MKKLWLAIALVFLANGAQANPACSSTINPIVPVQNSPLQSSVIRNNFANAYADVNTACGLIVPGGGGSGGYSYEQLVSTGTTATVASVGTNVLVNSASSGGKTINIPAATGTKQIITITDVYGNAGTSGQAVTAVPASGSIIGNNQVYTNNGSITLYDSANLHQWVSQ